KNRGDNRGDIVIAGSQLKAGGNTSLDAANDILLSGAANTQKTTGRNSSSGGGVGVSIGAGGNGAGISVFAGVNAAKGSEKGNGTEWTETTTDSGKTVTINSGRDTVLNGAQVNGNRIIADVGHDLLISSQQDTSKYDSKQTSVAAGGSFTFGSMTGSGYIAASRDKMKSRFDSVAEQTGMFAGDGGFDITVGRHTQLDGAVIASTATPDKNHLDTGTLGFSDLHNEADYKVSHSGISLSGGGSFGDKFQGNMPGGMISAGGHSGHAEGTTQAAVAEGIITIRDRDNQKQNLANLSRDPAHANDSISPIFDKEKEQRRLQTVGLISDIGSQVADIARTQGELNALKAAQDKYGPVPADATEEQRQAYLAKLRDTPEYKKEQEKYGTGSDMQRGIQAATAALQGLVGGNMAGALAGASAPELANIIGHHAGIDDNTAAKAIAHAILGGVTAALQGNSAAAGAIGAGTGEVIASAIAKSLYPGVDPSKLTEDQKQTVSTLATLSAGMAGGIASGDVAGAAAGAGAGKNVVENNALSLVARGCAVAAPCRTKVAEQLLEIGAKAGMAGLAGAAVKDMADRMTSDELEHLITLQMMGNDEITTKYLSSLHDKYGSGAASNPNIGKDLTDAEKVELGGSGSGTGTPPPSENDPKQQNEKPVDKLNQKQESAIKKIDNTIKNALKDHDIIGTLKDMDGKPVPKENGGYWDHMQEMQNTLRGLRNHADTLKNVNNPEAQAAYGRATDAINKIESALKGYGI
ncbi:TPA: hemagglutinin repeat-containing protein, partial [Escherichia coli]|nr:Contact-dependent inhibitor A [Escherichia coli]EGG7851314.1 Contact-dependent inhibitor A [Escherichia coli]EGG9442705.1 Contact-dependent inhibitor A [Escherichia coli]EGH2009634.1 Contact-dependent inhibitor A [Escherichia coli]EIS6890720.1 hemagglutinin repeat-containing protein [Escherichia coli]